MLAIAQAVGGVSCPRTADHGTGPMSWQLLFDKYHKRKCSHFQSFSRSMLRLFRRGSYPPPLIQVQRVSCARDHVA